MAYTKLFSREYSLQYSQTAMRALAKTIKNHSPVSLRTTLIVPEQNNEAYYAKDEEWNKFLSKLENLHQRPADQKKFIKAFDFWGKKYVKTARKIGQLNFAKISNSQLANYYLNYILAWDNYTAYLWLGFTLNESFSTKFQQSLGAKQLLQEVLKALLQPAKKVGLLILQNEIKHFKNLGYGKLPKPLAKKLLKRWGWMPCLDLQHNPWTILDMQTFYRHARPSKKILPFKKALAIASLQPNQKTLCQALRGFVYVKEMRDVYRRQGIFYILPLFNEIGKRLKASRVQLAYCTNREIMFALKNKHPLPPRASLTARQKGFLMYWQKNKIFFSTNKKLIKKTRAKISRIEHKIIQGIVAQKGNATGRVKIILTSRDIGKIKAGDILVAITTHPDFIMAMRKAKAFVTDEGGLTSHAALVARELGIPCIVGTKMATKMLKDGDIVTVNANEGTVKKIS